MILVENVKHRIKIATSMALNAKNAAFDHRNNFAIANIIPNPRQLYSSHLTTVSKGTSNMQKTVSSFLLREDTNPTGTITN
jgi:hypothetical protein